MFNRRLLKELIKWKDKESRKPLIIRGARQVGKTSLVKLFGEQYFEKTIYINLENFEHKRLFENEMSINEFEQIVAINFKLEITPGNTLIFIDEIQNCPTILNLFRFFYEKKPELHLIGAGSLFEVMIMREGFSLPVGRIEYMYLYPLDFFEYLEIKGESKLLKYLQEIDRKTIIAESIHQTALSHFYEYCMIGGMPEIAATYLKTKKSIAIESIYPSLLTAYGEDVYKYTNLAQGRYLKYVIDQSPLFAGTIFTYEKFGQHAYNARELRNAFETLEKVMILKQIPATQSVDIPITAQYKRPKKLLFLDIGLVNYRSGINHEYINLKDLNELFRGRIAEQVVGQQLVAQSIFDEIKLHYWARFKAQAAAELDYCINSQGSLIGIEVKSGSSMKLRSLISFADRVKNSHLVRVYSGELKNEEISFQSKIYRILSIPFYLTPRLFDLI